MRVDLDVRLARYYGRGFGYYFWREDRYAVLTLAFAVVAAVFAGIWWIWLLIALDLVVFGFMAWASYGAWRALQNLGDATERLRQHMAGL